MGKEKKAVCSLRNAFKQKSGKLLTPPSPRPPKKEKRGPEADVDCFICGQPYSNSRNKDG